MLLLLAFLWPLAAADVPPLGRSYWENYGREELEASLKSAWNTGVARNVIIFIGDGMGPNTVTAARIYQGGEEGFLSWERFRHVGALKTYSEDKTVTDSAASGTSLFTGVKTINKVVGVSGAVKVGDCATAQKEEAKLTHITTDAQQAGKSVGIVTTARVTHATPACLYAHSAHRDWEGRVPEGVTCKDIGRQMVEDLPARDFKVILGGGMCALRPNIKKLSDADVDPCYRVDSLDLVKAWQRDKADRNATYRFVEDTASLKSVDVESTDYLLGVFTPGHMDYEYKRNRSDAGAPSLQDMAITALKVLMKNKNGFLLMVEAEHVDLAHHMGHARTSLNEVVLLSRTVDATMKLLEEAGLRDETLVIVTSDHSHTLTISGYPKRGNSILGVADTSIVDNTPYTTLMYANGKNGYHYFANGSEVLREDPSKVNTSAWDYGAQVAVQVDKNTHGGHDVFVYASGPFAHLFHHMHEQNYVAYVIRYAAAIGEYRNRTHAHSDSTSSSPPFTSPSILVSLVQNLLLILSLTILTK